MKTRNLRRIGAAAVTVALAALGLQAATAAPAAAVAGLVRQVGAATPNDSQVDKNARATCPSSSPRIVGGGIVIDDGGRHLAFARSTTPLSGLGPNGEDQWFVAATLPPGVGGTYSLRAIAVCARAGGVPGHEVVPGAVVSQVPGSTTLDSVAICKPGKRVIGVGGGVFNGGRAVGLSAVRSAGPRDISRAFARDRFGDTDGVWQMQASAICMTSSDTREATWAAVPGNTASILCQDSPNFFVHGPGGGSWTGTGLIHRIEPLAGLKQTTVITTPGSTATLVSTICLP